MSSSAGVDTMVLPARKGRQAGEKQQKHIGGGMGWNPMIKKSYGTYSLDISAMLTINLK